MNIKKCPICGSEPQLEILDMGRGNGHGYPGNTDYVLKCPNCKTIHVSADDIYDNDKSQKAPERVIVYWNKEVDKINNFLEWRKEEKTNIHPFAKKLIISMLKGKDIKLTEDLLQKLIEEVEKL